MNEVHTPFTVAPRCCFEDFNVSGSKANPNLVKGKAHLIYYIFKENVVTNACIRIWI